MEQYLTYPDPQEDPKREPTKYPPVGCNWKTYWVLRNKKDKKIVTLTSISPVNGLKIGFTGMPILFDSQPAVVNGYFEFNVIDSGPYLISTIIYECVEVTLECLS